MAAPDSFKIIVGDNGDDLSKYCISYDCSSDFLGAASDSFSCELFSDDVTDLRLRTLPWLPITFLVNGSFQFFGQIETQSIADDTTISITCSDYFCNAVDCDVGRNLYFEAGDQIGATIKRLMQSQQTTKVVNGWNDVRNRMAGRSVYTGTPASDPTTKKLGEYLAVKPEDGIWENINKICGLYDCLPKAGLQVGDVHLAVPEYRQSPAYSFTRLHKDQLVNFRGPVTRDLSNFPTVITSYGQTGKDSEVKKGTFYKVKPFDDLFARDAEMQQIARPNGKPRIYDGRFDYKPGASVGRVLYRELRVESKDARNQAELNSYAKRIASDAMKDCLRVDATIDGHSRDGVIITPDTMAKFNDSVGGVYVDLWISKRTHRFQGNDQTTEFSAFKPASINL